MVGKLAKLAALGVATALVAGCGGNGMFGGGGLFSGERGQELRAEQRAAREQALIEEGLIPDPGRETIFDLFSGAEDPNTNVEVNRYLWNASLEILDFMPVEAADPFSGVIQFGYGTPPGGRQAYRATVYVQDPALEARSLRVAVQSRGGAVSRDVARQIEDAILTRARQIRIRDSNL
ncbi:MAG: DUF3576 domain-containing protein [Roseicyclus sp.]|uniref:DUF3576 domain-containing protein n=1 Tax=Roseicyclus sp. TaxID=1914329 RepID=UPI003A884244